MSSPSVQSTSEPSSPEDVEHDIAWNAAPQRPVVAGRPVDLPPDAEADDAMIVSIYELPNVRSSDYYFINYNATGKPENDDKYCDVPFHKYDLLFHCRFYNPNPIFKVPSYPYSDGKNKNPTNEEYLNMEVNCDSLI